MAGAGLLALIDDIATILDDVAVMSKVAAKKTAGVVGDDLALNAQGLTGIQPERELPVVWAVAKGSLVNKAILIPAAILISTFAPWLVTPLMMIGGAFLCYEGVEKVIEKLFHKKDHSVSEQHQEQAFINDPVAFEKDKIKTAIRTDFILSAEIMVISLGAVAAASIDVRIGVLVLIGLAMTIGVYGLVAGLIKLDDFGLYLTRKASSFARKAGQAILAFVPYLMKVIGLIGTLAMFIVGGEIILHGIHPLEEWLHHQIEGLPAALKFISGLASAIIIGVISGFLAIPVFNGLHKLVQKLKKPKEKSLP